jgi:hypothetical protein
MQFARDERECSRRIRRNLPDQVRMRYVIHTCLSMSRSLCRRDAELIRLTSISRLSRKLPHVQCDRNEVMFYAVGRRECNGYATGDKDLRSQAFL